MKNKLEAFRMAAVTAVFFSIIIGLTVLSIVLPDKALSYTERRKLEQMPKISVSSVMSKRYMQKLETCCEEQFPVREELRRLKSFLNYYILRQKAVNKIYLSGEHAVKIEYPMDEKQVNYCAEKINSVYKKYLQGMNVYISVIPDKNYFEAEKNKALSIDYDYFMDFFRNRLTDNITYIDIFKSLAIDDYYYSDSHWKQPSIEAVRDTIADRLGVYESLPAFESYEAVNSGDFDGVFKGQSALNTGTDSIIYLTNSTIENAVVHSAEDTETLKVYAPEKVDDIDPYNVFLHGAKAFLVIENEECTTGKELVIFRDSFGSSIAPLFIDAYSKITLIDLRYVASDYLPNLIEFENQDILFLYSTSIINGGMILR